MRFPTPRNGWRTFFGEVGIIVLGVLLALGAQQAAETLQMRSEVREFRRTVDHEIGLNLFVYDVRSRGSACNERRIRALLEWLTKAKEGESLPRLNLYPPSILMPYRGAWDSRDGNVFAAVPAEARQKYAEFYDELDGNSDRIGEELGAWQAIKGYEIAGPASIDDRRTIYRHLVMALGVNQAWAANMPVSKKIAEELRVEPVQPDNISKQFLAEIDMCESIFVPAKAGAETAASQG